MNDHTEGKQQMDQTLDCIMLARRKKVERKRIEECLANKGNCEIIVARHRLRFNGKSQYVTITRASEDDPFACKIRGCRMPYEVLLRLLGGTFDNMEGFEWL